MSQTARIAEPIGGDQLYKERARRVLPLLVRQAEAGETILYSSLAQELGMPNPRTLNYPLGSIGQTLERLSKVWKEKIPPIQCLVTNKNTGLPSEGIGWFLIRKDDFFVLPTRQKKEIVKAELARIFAYHRWRDVLRVLSLSYVPPNFSELTREAAGSAEGGESDEHRRLKEFVARNPGRIGLPSTAAVGRTEVALASGDSLDVSFRVGHEWIAAEVKSLRSDAADIVRGMFQCVKYRAVMEATQVARGNRRAGRAVLVLQGTFPSELIPLRNILGVETFEAISP